MSEFYRRKKICQMCAGKPVNYKEVAIVSKYINEKGKILPRRMTGVKKCKEDLKVEKINITQKKKN